MRHLPKAPLQPGVARKIIPDDGEGRAPELYAQPFSVPAPQLLSRELVPVLRPLEPQLLPQPVQIAAAVGPLVPEPLGHLSKAPLQPLVLWQVVFEQREKR